MTFDADLETLCDIDGATLLKYNLKNLTDLGVDLTMAQRILDEVKNISDTMIDIPDEFLCPITCDLMYNPVKCSDGFVYDECAIKEWLLTRRNTSPMTNLAMPNSELTPCTDLKSKIEAFKLNM